mgnify:FL=1
MDISNFQVNTNCNQILTPMTLFTVTANAKLSGISDFKENFASDMKCTPVIAKIENDLVEKSHPIITQYIKVKSNRGRKKQVKITKTRKTRGKNNQMSSMTQFTVLLHDKYYKIKVFRNGSISIPGVLQENMSDIKPHLNALIEYLSKHLNTQIKLEYIKPSMMNYKFSLQDSESEIYLEAVVNYLRSKQKDLITVNTMHVLDFIQHPAFSNDQFVYNWYELIDRHYMDLDRLCVKINYQMLIKTLQVHPVRSISITEQLLQESVNKLNLEQLYQDTIKKIIYLKFLLNSAADFNKIFKLVLLYRLDWKKFRLQLEKNPYNSMAWFTYTDKYPGLLLKIKAGNIDKPKKSITVKIFTGGKINIDGAETKTQATRVYNWLNNHLLIQPGLIYNINHKHDIEDSEFSESDPSSSD